MSLHPNIIVREQARQLFQSITSSSIAQLFIIACFYVMFRHIVNINLLTLWFISISTVVTLRFLLSWQYNKNKPSDEKKWLQRFTFLTLLLGISWASFSLFYLITDDAILKALFIVLTCGVMSAAVPVLAAWSPAFYANTIPQFITLLLILLVQNEATSYFLSVALVMYYFMLFFLHRDANHNIKKSFQLEHKNDELVSKLNAEVTQREQLITERTHELNDSLKRLDIALETSQQGWFDLNIQTGEIVVSDEYPRLLGYEPNEFHSNFQTWQDNIHPDDLSATLNAFHECIKTGQSKEAIYRRKTRDNQWLWFHSVGEVIEWVNQHQPLRMVGIHRDITQQKQAEEALKTSEIKFHTLFDSTTDAVIISEGLNFIDANEATLTLFGCSSIEELCTRTVADVSPEEQPCGTNSTILAQQHISKAIEQGSHHFEWMHKRIDTNESFPADVLLNKLTINGRVMVQATVRNITERKKSEEKLNLMAHYDVLTKLPNRMLFADRFHQAIAHSKRTGNMLAVCFLDLDNFKPINDTFGHDTGDKLLIEVADRLRITIREEDTASRQGGDEFALLLRDIESFAQCDQLLERIRHSLAQPYLINDYTHNISVSIGSTIYPIDNSDLDTLLRHADKAMYQAKLAGKNQQQQFNSLNDQQVVHRLTKLQQIKQALANKEFCLYYQPKVNLNTGEVFGVEALIRWSHPNKGLISPLDFLPFITNTDVEIQLGGWVINEAIQQLDLWQQQHNIKLEVSINISSHHLQSSAFFDQLNEALDMHPNVDSEDLQLEILESSALGDIDTIGGIITSCQTVLGVNVALDDFGTGYSSLTHMKHLSANTIKIDQSFVRDVLCNPHDFSIIEGVIGLAHAFNRKVIAEGVESEDQGLALIIMGCTQAQGFAIARPIPANDIPEWFANYTPNQYWVKYSNEKHTEQENQIKLLQLTTKHWFENIEHALQTQEDGNYDQYLVKCHLGAWLPRFKEQGIFDDNLLNELQQAHDIFYSQTSTLVKAYQAGDIDTAKAGMDELKVAYQNVEDLLSK